MKQRKVGMAVKGMYLSWIVVKDLKKALDYYTNVVGLKLNCHHEDYHWAELQGEDGSILGIGQENDEYGVKAGVNSIVTITVDNLDEAIAKRREQGMKFIDEVVEIPGHVKMITFEDPDGNHFQLVEKLD
jgi:predicted enzyme related to lactoylglutathione lyase